MCTAIRLGNIYSLRFFADVFLFVTDDSAFGPDSKAKFRRNPVLGCYSIKIRAVRNWLAAVPELAVGSSAL